MERGLRLRAGMAPKMSQNCMASESLPACTKPCRVPNARHVVMGVLQVGKGRQAYSRAKEYVRQWKHMDLGWVDTNKPLTQVRHSLSHLYHALAGLMRS